jgi:DNA-binding beta-propeller fold protein YncE
MPRESQGQAVEPTKSAMDQAAERARLGCRVGWWSACGWDLARRAQSSTPLDFGGGPIDVSITAVAFSPDGRTTASGLDNGKVVLTRVPDGTLLYELATTGGPGPIGLAPIALAFSPDGKPLATATHDGKVRLWDPRTGSARGPAWVAEAGEAASRSFSPDGSILATSGNEGTTTLWDVRSGKQIGPPLTGSPTPAVAAFDPTGHTLATAFQDGTVLLWDVDPRLLASTGLRRRRPPPHPAGVVGLPPGPALPALLWHPVTSRAVR